MTSRQRIKDFVQQILGCTCPDKVFEHIEDRQVAPLAAPHTRSITIGGRLLIYIWHVRDTSDFAADLQAMVAAGQKARDEQGLNRFRAVLAVEKGLQQFDARAKACAGRFVENDDRLHIQVISSAALQNI